MAPSSRLLLLLLQLLSCISAGLACYCERYSWTSWSTCTRTCNGGRQHRNRNIIQDEYFWKSSCNEICSKDESRACNQQACPINCLLTEFGPWSDCSPCASKQYRTRGVQRPNQFGGSPCSTELIEERPCIPTKECIMPPAKCKDKFKCDNGRCLDPALRCNGQNDCVDNSDERNCPDIQSVCPTERRVAPGSDLPGNGYDALSGEQRGAVLDNTFMGGDCTIIRPRDLPHLLIYFRVPYNFHSFSIKVGAIDDFNIEPRQVYTDPVTPWKSTSRHDQKLPYDVPLLGDRLARIFTIYLGGVSRSGSQSYRDLFEASKTLDSKFFRVHQILPVSTFRIKEPGDLVLSVPFLQFLQALPLDYNYALYREIFQRFGTHYYSSGTLGGHYDMLYQYDRQELISSGETEQHTSGCLNKDSTFTVILYTQVKHVNRCSNTKITEKYRGSYIQASKKSFSKVRGGGSREAGALAFERHENAPNKEAYKNWAKSVIENPVVVENKVLPLIDLVRGIPCAATKRRHLKKALTQYLEEFDPCKCNPCPNNGRPILSGTECKCVCLTGTFGTNCELRAPDYTSEAVDGYWSCWGPWSGCGASMRRQRTRECNNPSPISGGQPCDGPSTEEEPCHISIFEKQDTCENDDDFTIGWIDELPPGVQGCLRPQRPANSFLRKSKQYYDFGEDEEFQCFTGFHMEGFQYINCLPDGTWSQPAGKCIRNICPPPEIPAGVSMSPVEEEYSVGDVVHLSCDSVGQWVTPHSTFTCSESLTWEPALPTDLRCTRGETVIPNQCGPGQRLEGTQCVCVPRESCLAEPADACVLNVNVGAMVSMSLCAYHAGRCHKDPLFFVSEGVCDPDDDKKLEWAKFRAKMSSKSSAQVPCGPDTCYDWETCSAMKTCVCKAARNCPRDGQSMSCARMTRTQSTRSLSVCSMAALKCSSYDFEVLYDGPCIAR